MDVLTDDEKSRLDSGDLSEKEAKDIIIYRAMINLSDVGNILKDMYLVLDDMKKNIPEGKYEDLEGIMRDADFAINKIFGSDEQLH